MVPKMLPRNHQTSFPVLRQLPLGRWISIPASEHFYPNREQLLRSVPCTCEKQNPPTSAWKTQPKPLQKLQPSASAAWTHEWAPKVSRERQHLGPQETWLVSSPLQSAAKEISCSLSSLLAPFLHKANLVNSSTAPAQGHKLL